MNDHHIVEVLLAEDNPRDAELNVRALKQHNLTNRLVHVAVGLLPIHLAGTSPKRKVRYDETNPKSNCGTHNS